MGDELGAVDWLGDTWQGAVGRVLCCCSCVCSHNLNPGTAAGHFRCEDHSVWLHTACHRTAPHFVCLSRVLALA